MMVFPVKFIRSASIVALDISLPASAFGDERADLSTPDDITVGVDLFRKHGGDIALRH